ncbi:MAG TPA: hydroxymethylglutaryl-CoA reductase [Caldimonas sp.]|jgi:hydroxymethylglutaryl-CoA reductase (NADPH)|nr:hydroxymethylglutaryl-CoA reductase [Caldimonas sp.]
MNDRPAFTFGLDKVPRDPNNDYTAAMAERRRDFAREHCGSTLENVGRYTIDPATLSGNMENFFGVAQVPMGLAGPLHIRGEHAQGTFYVPMATTEGTLVASYNRGMRLLAESGGVKTTVVEQFMQRSPVFMFDDALAARDFGVWVEEHMADLRREAEATTHVGRLVNIYQYAVGPMRNLRFNYTTGDAAGQNMVGKATLAACEWIAANYPGGAKFMLSGNMDTDKKHSRLNMLVTRGKRVVAEAVIKKEAYARLMGVDTTEAFAMRQVSNVGAFLAGSSNNGAHAANGLTALFIATGQDVANVSESHAGVVYNKLLGNGDYYWSITLTSLIVGTHGGGTGLATQRECLEMLGCYGAGNADKFAEICAGTVLAGETSLTGAILHGDWVSSHEQFGRNREK